MQARSLHHLTAILQAGNDNEATYQYRHYDNAIHVVQRKHQHLFLQHHWFTARLGENTCSQNMGMNAGSHHLTASFLSRQLQLSNLPVYKLCQIVTMQAMWCKGEESSTLVCPIRLVCLNDRQLDANNPPVSVYTLTTQPRWSNQIISICLYNTMGLHQVLEDSHALRMWGFMQVRSI